MSRFIVRARSRTARGNGRAPRLLVWLALSASLAAPLRAQTSVAMDSVSVAPGIRAAGRLVGASRAVVDSNDVRQAMALTFSELMQARAASVGVMMSGGTLTDGGRFLIRGPSTLFTGGAPLLVVDGMRMDEQEDDSLSIASRLDDIAIDDIATVEVLRGPAAATLYGLGASSGVIVVTTKRGSQGGLRLRGRVLADARSMSRTFPDNYARRGVRGTPPQPTICGLTEVASGGCTPTSLEQWNPLAAAGVFRTGVGVAAAASASAGSATRDGRLSLSARRASGVAPDDELTQLHSRLNVTQRFGPSLNVRGHLAYVGAKSNRSAVGRVIYTGLTGPAPGDEPRPFWPTPAQAYEHPMDQSLGHYTVGAEAAYRRGRWLTVRGAHAYDRVETSAVGWLDPTHYSGFYPDVRTAENRIGAFGVKRSTRATAELAHGVLGKRGVRAQLVAGFEREARERVREESLAVINGQNSGGWRQRISQGTGKSVFASERVSFGERFAMGVGLRRELSPVKEVASLNLPSADLAWLVPVTVAGSTLRLRAAYGESVQPFANFTSSPVLAFSRSPFSSTQEDELKPERLRELEAGVDLRWGSELSAELTAFDRTTSDALVTVELPSGFGYRTGLRSADIKTHGVELDVRARALERAGLRWEVRGVVSLHSNKLSSRYPEYYSGTTGKLRDGQPVFGGQKPEYAFSDANGDGIITPKEVGPEPENAKLSSASPTFEGALHSTVSLGSHISLTAIIDRRSGFASVLSTERNRCYSWCRGTQDPSSTLDEQARSISLSRNTLTVEDASFTRLREVSLRWSVPARFARAMGAPGMTLLVGGRDLFLWSGWAGIDPEITTNARGALVHDDLRGVPLARRVMIGLELGGGGR